VFGKQLASCCDTELWRVFCFVGNKKAEAVSEAGDLGSGPTCQSKGLVLGGRAMPVAADAWRERRPRPRADEPDGGAEERKCTSRWHSVVRTVGGWTHAGPSQSTQGKRYSWAPGHYWPLGVWLTGCEWIESDLLLGWGPRDRDAR